MEKSDITSKNFQNFIARVLANQIGRAYKPSLSEYLRSLWGTINKYKDVEVDFPLLATIIEEAFMVEPLAFDDQWLAYEKPLSWNYRDGVYVIEKLEGVHLKIVASNVDDFEILKHTILFQIADLHRMQGNQLENEGRYFGVNSPTGNRWYNFDPQSYLECATQGMADHAKNAVASTECDWADFAGMLELGRLYE